MDGGCSLAKAADCVCTNTTLQAHVSQCVQTSCIYADQVGTLQKFHLDVKACLLPSRPTTDRESLPLVAAHISRDLCRGYPIEDRRSSTRIPAIVLPAITIAVVLLRCISRIAVAKGMWWDDWIALVTTDGVWLIVRQFFLSASGVIALISMRIPYKATCSRPLAQSNLLSDRPSNRFRASLLGHRPRQSDDNLAGLKAT
ncbi:Integral membrane protein [Colletotrichum higginsianum IMI 349063]|uniref:Integral membrane protein n=1 Tax=Colletotrichum higginsianum (strain IMI 349063) TaxID=759273 RepID=A0A1B7YKH6_COLHI|nr:Integral membrane protein [Colletotrichum higginsianum IMI 349063]OBR12573.1 Integral membrane protein [Colletotrichum higginsianum IMI 349063]